MMTTTRRTVLRTAALATAMLASPFVRGSNAAGRLSVAFWDHWVPGANKPLEQLCREWAEKEKVDITVDFITSNGDKDLLTAAAEAQARTGHDIMQLTAWYAPGHAASLEPVDDLMATLIQQNGKVSEGAAYLGKQDGHWIAVPTSFGSTLSPPCARIDLMKQLVGLDITKMYPAGAPPDKELQDQWNWDYFSQAAEKCFKGGHSFGMPISTGSDSVQWVGAMFNSYGARLVDARRQHHRQQRRHPHRARLVQENRAVLSRERLCLGRRRQQQGADLRAQRVDLQRPIGLGRGEARPAENRRTVVDVSAAEGTQGPARFRPLPLLGDLELLAEQGGGEKPAFAFVR